MWDKERHKGRSEGVKWHTSGDIWWYGIIWPASDWTDPSGIWSDTQCNILFHPLPPFLLKGSVSHSPSHNQIRIPFPCGMMDLHMSISPKFQPPKISNPWPVLLSVLNFPSAGLAYDIDRILVLLSIIRTRPYSRKGHPFIRHLFDARV